MRVWFLHLQTVITWCLICLAIGVFWGTQYLEVQSVVANFSDITAGIVVVIDAGHGGVDPGAISASGILEKDITLAIALELEALLNRAAIYSVMVRREDVDLADLAETRLSVRKHQDLDRRVLLAEKSDADLYVSIHVNYYPMPSLSGPQSFYFATDMQGKQLAKFIQAELVRQLGPNKRVAKAGDYRVLRDTAMPAALVEVGFLSNPVEADLLATASYQKQVANAIFLGIIQFLVYQGEIDHGSNIRN